MDKDVAKEDDFLGELRIPVVDIRSAPTGSIDQWYTLHPSMDIANTTANQKANQSVTGSVHLKLQWFNMDVSFRLLLSLSILLSNTFCFVLFFRIQPNHSPKYSKFSTTWTNNPPQSVYSPPTTTMVNSFPQSIAPVGYNSPIPQYNNIVSDNNNDNNSMNMSMNASIGNSPYQTFTSPKLPILPLHTINTRPITPGNTTIPLNNTFQQQQQQQILQESANNGYITPREYVEKNVPQTANIDEVNEQTNPYSLSHPNIFSLL